MISTKPAPAFAAVLIFWTVFGILSAGQNYVRSDGSSAPMLSVFKIVYFYWAWALVTPLVYRFARRLENQRFTWGRVVRQQVPLALMTVTLQVTLYTTMKVIDGRVHPDNAVQEMIGSAMNHGASGLLTYAVLVAGFSAFASYRRARARELELSQLAQRSSELEASLAQSRLAVLESQLQPHFLFNTLNTISTLIAMRDPIAANRAVARLGDLLRGVLDRSPTHEHTLQDELVLTQHYLDIVQLRFGDRLTITTQIPDDALDLLVPTLILQPQIENAIRHGVGERSEGGNIEISASVANAMLVLHIKDDGSGFVDATEAEAQGVGLRNSRARLAQLYGETARLDVSNVAGQGALVSLTIPAHRIPLQKANA